MSRGINPGDFALLTVHCRLLWRHCPASRDQLAHETWFWLAKCPLLADCQQVGSRPNPAGRYSQERTLALLVTAQLRVMSEII